jgi:hypothetical protein
MKTLSARQKEFARLIHAGKPVSTAYVEAGYKPDRGNACRLTANDNIQLYIRDLERRALEQHDITIDRVLTNLEGALQMAKFARNPGAMIQASLSQAKLVGLVVKKIEERTIDKMDKEEIVAEIRKRMGDKADTILQLLELDGPEAPAEATKPGRENKPNKPG